MTQNSAATSTDIVENVTNQKQGVKMPRQCSKRKVQLVSNKSNEETQIAMTKVQVTRSSAKQTDIGESSKQATSSLVNLSMIFNSSDFYYLHLQFAL